MLKLEFDAQTMKILALKNYFRPKALHPFDYERYESYFILKDGEPVFIIEERT